MEDCLLLHDAIFFVALHVCRVAWPASIRGLKRLQTDGEINWIMNQRSPINSVGNRSRTPAPEKEMRPESKLVSLWLPFPSIWKYLSLSFESPPTSSGLCFRKNQSSLNRRAKKGRAGPKGPPPAGRMMPYEMLVRSRLQLASRRLLELPARDKSRHLIHVAAIPLGELPHQIPLFKHLDGDDDIARRRRGEQ